MKHDIEETVIEALMCNEPTIIVEGEDDIKFYANVAKLINKEVNIQAIETIDGYSEGCENVRQAMEDLQEFLVRDERGEKYILGIIDRDVRYYRGEIPNLKGLFVLNYYSYESHLITNNTIRKQISLLTKVNDKMITDEVIEYVKKDFEKDFEKIYYISLEALKASCIKGYSGVVTYGKKAGNILGNGALDYIWNQISAKKVELDIFAETYNISMKDIKYVVKGKWLLFYWCEYISREVKKFCTLCGSIFPKCQFCEVEKNDKCLWRTEGNFQNGQIKKFLCSKELIDLDEIAYICDRIKLLAS